MNDQLPENPAPGEAPVSNAPLGASVPAASTPAGTSVLSTKLPSTLSLAIALLMFFLPFIELRCNNMPFAKFSGVQLATGFKIDMPGSDNTITGRLSEVTGSASKKQTDGNIYAITALLLTIISLVLAFLSAPAGVTGALITAALAAASLIVLMFNVKNQVAGEVSVDDDVVIRVDFAAAFYIAVLALIAGAWFCYRRLPFTRSASYSMLKG